MRLIAIKNFNQLTAILTTFKTLKKRQRWNAEHLAVGVVTKVGEVSVPFMTSQRSEFHIGTFRLKQKWSQRNK